MKIVPEFRSYKLVKLTKITSSYVLYKVQIYLFLMSF